MTEHTTSYYAASANKYEPFPTLDESISCDVCVVGGGYTGLSSALHLAALPCLVIKERDHPFGIWQLHSKEGQHAIKVTGPLSSNHGEIVHQWCLDGQGIALRSWWDVRENIASGHLVHVLPEFFQPANVWAVYVSRLATSAKIRTTVEFLRHYFQQHYPQHEPTASAVGRGD